MLQSARARNVLNQGPQRHQRARAGDAARAASRPEAVQGGAARPARRCPGRRL